MYKQIATTIETVFPDSAARMVKLGELRDQSYKILAKWRTLTTSRTMRSSISAYPNTMW